MIGLKRSFIFPAARKPRGLQPRERIAALSQNCFQKKDSSLCPLNHHTMKTYNIKLYFDNPDAKQALLDTMRLHNEIWNHLSQFVFKHRKVTDKELHDLTYHKCRKKFLEAPSQIIIRALMDVIATYKTIKSNQQAITESPVREQLAIRLDKRLFTLVGDSLKITTLKGRVPCRLLFFPKVLELMRQFPLCDPLIFERHGEIYLAMTFNTPEPIHTPNSCVGVDLGFHRIAVTSEGKVFKNSKYIGRKRQIRYLKSQLKRAKKNRKKKTDSARKHLRKLQRKERNFSRNYIHHLANDLLKTSSNVLVLEDLSGLKDKDRGRQQNNKLSQLPFFLTQQILTYKAQALGKRVETVNPAYTSKDDYRGIERGVRKGCRYYASDGKVLDADWNASINIALRWGKKHKLPVSFVEPVDGSVRLDRQAVCQSAKCWMPEIRQAPTSLA